VLYPLLRTLTDSGDAAEHYTCTDDASPGTTDDTRASAAIATLAPLPPVVGPRGCFSTDGSPLRRRLRGKSGGSRTWLTQAGSVAFEIARPRRCFSDGDGSVHPCPDKRNDMADEFCFRFAAKRIAAQCT
jgi:hypothetical protein